MCKTWIFIYRRLQKVYSLCLKYYSFQSRLSSHSVSFQFHKFGWLTSGSTERAENKTVAFGEFARFILVWNFSNSCIPGKYICWTLQKIKMCVGVQTYISTIIYKDELVYSKESERKVCATVCVYSCAWSLKNSVDFNTPKTSLRFWH